MPGKGENLITTNLCPSKADVSFGKWMFKLILKQLFFPVFPDCSDLGKWQAGVRPEGRKEKPWLDSLDWGGWASSGIRTISLWLTENVNNTWLNTFFSLNLFSPFIIENVRHMFSFQELTCEGEVCKQIYKRSQRSWFCQLKLFHARLTLYLTRLSVPTRQKNSQRKSRESMIHDRF